MNTDRRDHEPSLESRLRADARAARVAPPEGLEQRVSAAVWRQVDATRTAPQREPRRRSFRLLPPALAGLVTSACAVALVVLWHERADTARVSEADIRYLVDKVQTLPARLASADLTATPTLAVAAPLEREIESVRADARSALDFLAANFVPSQMLARPDAAPDSPGSRET